MSAHTAPYEPSPLPHAPWALAECEDAEWFALVVKPQHEKTVRHGLEAKGLAALLPLYTAKRVWADRRRELELPLFPGYVLCRFDRPRRTTVLRTPGVRSIVGFGNGPTPVPDEQIQGLQAMMASGRPLQPWPFLKAGETVRVEYGPLRGLCGVVLRLRDCWRVVLSLELLQRSVAVEVERDAIQPV